MITSGQADKLVALENPGDPIPDGRGGFTENWTPLLPGEMWAHIDAASQADQEQVAAGTVIGQGLFAIGMYYHAGVSLLTRIRYTDPDKGPRVFQVVSVRNPDEARRELILVAAELQP